jgi:hypothetical protein
MVGRRGVRPGLLLSERHELVEQYQRGPVRRLAASNGNPRGEDRDVLGRGLNL